MAPVAHQRSSIRFQTAPIERIVRSHGHVFFGYYDLQPWSRDGRWHLAHRVPFADRIPSMDDLSEVGVIDRETHRFVPLATTAAWNFQQGAMLQWNPARPDSELIFNELRDGAFRATVRNLDKDEIRTLPHPIASVSNDGLTGLSIDFSRMLDFRPGYGYAGLPDLHANVAAPKDRGIHRIDLKTGKTRQILSLAELSERFVSLFGRHMRGAKILVNHATLNPGGTRFVCLVRSMAFPGRPTNGWLTMVATADIEGQNIHVFDGHGGASHYCWRDDQHLLIYADMAGAGNMQLCLLKDQTQEFAPIAPDVFSFDGHCSYSTDRRFILYDSYPDAESYRKLLIYDTARKRTLPLAELYSVPSPIDARCDLHPRWSRDGSTVSFDSTHEGFRAIYTMDVRERCRDD